MGDQWVSFTDPQGAYELTALPQFPGGYQGAIAQRTHFCTMGAISDVVNMGDWTRMRMWGLAIGVAMLAGSVLTTLATRTLHAGAGEARAVRPAEARR